MKYLEEAAPGRARVATAVSGAGSIPPSGSSTSGGDKSPDGTPDRPFRVVAEFEMTITSTAPLRGLVTGGPRRDLAASRVVSVAPMGLPGPADILLTCRMVGPPSNPIDRINRLEAVPQQFGAFPIGTWGLAPDPTHPTVPSGDVIAATDRVILRAVAEIPGTRPGVPPAIPYRQVETGARRFLPFVVENDARRAEVVTATEQLAGFIPDATTAAERIGAAITLLAERGGRSAMDVAAWRRERSAVPLLGSLGEGLGHVQRAVDVAATAPPVPAAAPPPRPPQLRAVLVAAESGEPITAQLGGGGEPIAPTTYTTVSERLKNETKHVVVSPPKLADIDAGLLAAVPARLLRYAPPVAAAQTTVVAAVAPPLTRTVRPGAEIATGRATAASKRRGLTADTGGLMVDATAERAHINEGEIAVFELQDASRDADAIRRPSLILRKGRARVIALGPAGGVAIDRILTAGSSEDRSRVVIPPATRGLVMIGLGEGTGSDGVSGWVSEVPLPSATDGVLVAAGCMVDAVGRVPTRGVAALRSGWVAPDDLVAGESAVTTTFAVPIDAVAIALEGGTGPDFVLGVDGAERPIGPDKTPEAPVLVSDRTRSVLVYRLVKSRPGTAVTVTTGAARRLAGIAAMSADAVPGIDPAAALANAIANGGLAAIVPPVAKPGSGGAEFEWKGALS